MTFLNFFKKKKGKETDALKEEIKPIPAEELEKQLQDKIEEIEKLKLEVENNTSIISNLKQDLQKKEEELRLLNLRMEEQSFSQQDITKKNTQNINSVSDNDLAKPRELEQKIKNDKKIEDLEEEIEDLEDEIESKSKKFKEEKKDLEAKIQLLTKQKEAIQSLLDEKDEKLEDLAKEDTLKSESIDFVNEILNAKPANDTDAIKISAAVQKAEDIILEQFIDWIDDLKKFLYKSDNPTPDWKKKTEKDVIMSKELFSSNITRWGNQQRKPWIKDKKVVAFIGEFSAGKTSIVNRILSQDDSSSPKLPVSSKATTAIATYISYGNKFSSCFTNPAGDLKSIKKSTFEKVNKDILAKVNISPIINYFVMMYNNQNLKGLSILDTPGFSSNDNEDQARTLDVINESSALFWVMDANTGEINRSSLEIIANNLNNIPLYIIINKCDNKTKNEIDQLENHIKQTIAKAGINVAQYIRFSQKKELNELMRVINQLQKRSTNNNLESVYTDITSITSILLNRKTLLRNEKRSKANEYEEEMDEIETLFSENNESLIDLQQKPEPQEHFFSKDDYRMSTQDYNEMCDMTENIIYQNTKIKSHLETLNQLQKDIDEIDNNISDFNEILSKFISIKNQFLNALKDADPSAYIEIKKQEKRNTSN